MKITCGLTCLKKPSLLEVDCEILEVGPLWMVCSPALGDGDKLLTLVFEKRGLHNFRFTVLGSKLSLVAGDADQKIFQALWAEFLVSLFEGPTVKDLIKEGFNVRGIKHAISISHVKTDAEYQEILKLRYYVNKVVENLPLPAESPEQFADNFDTHSTIIMAKIGGRLVGTNRITFIKGDLSKSEYAPLGMVSEAHQKKGFVESTKMVTLPEYRGSDVFIRLLNESGRVVLESGEKYVLGDTWKHLLPVYAKLGYESTGVKNPEDDGWQVVVDMDRVVNIKSIGLFTWYACYGELIAELYAKGSVKVDFRTKLALKLRPLVEGRLELLFYKNQERKRRAKKAQGP
ncbi:MAG TPA: hypothetical protein VNJ01_11650 [Bacteriovoracaceae bacterium]|nr:hypothetical protein [Bacteriovoracaceae bacterium]